MKRVPLAALMVALAAPLAVGSTIDAGNWTIPQATGQTVTVVVYSDISETAKSLNFSTSLVNGPGGSTDLLFTALDFDVTGFMWDGANLQTPFAGPPATSAQGGAGNISGVVPIPGTQASPVGLVRVTLDASSAPLGRWDFLLKKSGGFGLTHWSPSDGPQPTLMSGTITVTPEPTMLAELLGLVGLGGLGLFFRRR